ncbi:hypothetical protein HQ447_03685 [bacterium]|nr:hypothetical protein [bacterium]
MKTSQLAVIPAAFLAVCTLMPTRAQSQTTPTIPVGDLTAFPTVVQTGTKPTLTWSINYPSIVENFVTVSPTGSVTPKENMICDIRVLGAGVTSQNSNGTITYYRTSGQIRYNGSNSWATIFDGKNTDTIVQQQGIIKTYNVTRNLVINFAGQYYNGGWKTLYTSLSGTNVRALVSGQTCPGNIPDYNAPSLESFLKPYLDSTKKVRIGPMDVIIIMELTHTDQSNVGYDLQDLVLLATFRKP